MRKIMESIKNEEFLSDKDLLIESKTTKLDDLLKKIRSGGKDPAEVYIDSIQEKDVWLTSSN